MLELLVKNRTHFKYFNKDLPKGAFCPVRSRDVREGKKFRARLAFFMGSWFGEERALDGSPLSPDPSTHRSLVPIPPLLIYLQESSVIVCNAVGRVALRIV